MKLRVELPSLGPAVEGAVITTWHKQVGDQIAYGDELCDVTVEEVTRLRRRLNPKDTVNRKPSRLKYKKWTGVKVSYRLTSLDTGTLTEIVASEGTGVRVGEQIAALGLDGQDESASSGHASRVVVDRIESEGEGS